MAGRLLVARGAQHDAHAADVASDRQPEAKDHRLPAPASAPPYGRRRTELRRPAASFTAPINLGCGSSGRSRRAAVAPAGRRRTASSPCEAKSPSHRPRETDHGHRSLLRATSTSGDRTACACLPGLSPSRRERASPTGCPRCCVGRPPVVSSRRCAFAQTLGLPGGAVARPWWGRVGRRWYLLSYRRRFDVRVLDAAGRRRSPAAMSGQHAGRPPRNNGIRHPADRRRSMRSSR